MSPPGRSQPVSATDGSVEIEQPAHAGFRRTLLIVNPISGHGRGKRAITAVSNELGGSGPVDIVVTAGAGDAERAAASAVEAGYQRVVAAGGDGTVNEVVNGLAGSDTEMGIIPVGTANVLARELRLPVRDVRAAAAVVKAGVARRIDLGRAGSRYFAAMAGFGLDASVVRRIHPRVKGLIGVAAYGFAIAGALVKEKPARFTLDLDGERVETEAFIVIVANSARYAYGIEVAPHASLDDGKLDVIIFQTDRPKKLALLHQAYRVLAGSHMRDPNIRYLNARHVKVDAEPRVLAQFDGDLAGATPMEIEIAPKSLIVIAPE